ncbi:MAG: phosphoglycerate mutase family protein, partial [Bacillota bacterium]|nr:phosphoglycerate mutase family protein [Bacillota bacterium]
MELLIIRHGRSQGDDENRVEGGGWDAPLTEKGRAQATKLAQRLKE